MKSLVVRQSVELKEFISKELGISRNKAKDIVDRRNVLVNDRRVWIATHQLERGDVVDLIEPPSRAPGPAASLPVIYEDGHIIALNKPPGLVSDQDPNSAEEMLKKSRAEPRIRAIHRLDKDTSGVFLLARDVDTFEWYKKIWGAREVEKIYRAICFSAAVFEQTTIGRPIGGRSAVSKVSLLARARDYSYFEIVALTGRKHQIRVHLNGIHHPIVGDTEYGPKIITDPRIKDVRRQMLHCLSISLPVMDGGQRVKITAPIPPDFQRLAHRLGLD